MVTRRALWLSIPPLVIAVAAVFTGMDPGLGQVVDDHPGMVTMKTAIGGSRVVDMLSGEQLPRIC